MPDSKKTAKPVAPEGDALGLGERLRSARKARAMSLEQVSEALRLDAVTILALEEERFESLGAPVFIKGHLKSYAQLVGLSAETVLSYYRDSTVSSEIPPKLISTVDRSVTINPVTWGFYALVIILALALVIYVFQSDDEEAVSLDNTGDSTEMQGGVEPAGDDSAEINLPDSLEQPTTSEAAIETGGEETPVGQTFVEEVPAEPALAEEASAEQIAAEAPGDRLVRLDLFFRKESWVEISDVERRLLFGLQREGIRRELTGEPPFRLLLGNSDAIDLYLNDEPYAVPQDRVNGQVARFIIDPPLDN
jgi:cytoskeleton protein RodZ